MARRTVFAIILVFLLLFSSNIFVDTGVDIVSDAKAVVLEVGPGKTYLTIQAAVDAAQLGDTVFVYAGVYNETLIIDKTINLTGEDKNLVFLDGLGGTWAVLINTDFVNISGLTVTNATWGLRLIFGSNIKVSDTILMDNSIGIFLEDVTDGIIIDNEVMNSSEVGIRGYDITGCRISYNEIVNNTNMGIHVVAFSSVNMISNNNVHDNTFDGIYINQGPFNNSIENNSCFNNGQNGIRSDQGSHNNYYTNNTSINNGNVGIDITGGSNNKVEDNWISNNYRSMWLSGCDNSSISNNTFNNATFGVYFVLSNDISFSNNLIYNHSNNGLSLEESNGNFFINNTLYNNFNNVYCRGQSRDNILANCTLYNSTSEEIRILQDSQLVSINSTFNRTEVNIISQNSWLKIQWYLHLNVLKPDLTPAIGARVRIEDSDNGSLRETYQTGYDGKVDWLTVTEYVETSAGRTYFAPFNLSAWTRNLTAWAEPKIEASEFVTLTLGEPVFYKKLYKGWNLLSIPLLQTDNSTASVLSSISGKYDAVEHYNGSEEQWHFYPSGDLTEINPAMGIWIHMAEDAVLSLNGTLPIRFSYRLNASGSGWNLIGYPSMFDDFYDPVDDFESLRNKYFAVQVYETPDNNWRHSSINKPPELNDLAWLGPGHGYWVHAATNGVVKFGPEKIAGAMDFVDMGGGFYIGSVISLSGTLPLIDTEFVIYDSSLGQSARQDPIRDDITLQVGVEGVDMNSSFLDTNENKKIDAGDIFRVQNGASGDTIALINRLTGETVCMYTIP